jgi:hypothetical protein
VTLGNHAFDHVRPLRRGVNGALGKVDAGYEEGGLEAVRGKLVEDAVSIDVWATFISRIINAQDH